MMLRCLGCFLVVSWMLNYLPGNAAEVPFPKPKAPPYTPPPMFPKAPADVPRLPAALQRPINLPLNPPPNPFKPLPIPPRMFRAKTAPYPSGFQTNFPEPITAAYPVVDFLSPPALISQTVKGGNPGQQYLGLVNDMRDLEIGVENTKALAAAAKQTEETFTDLHARETQLYESHAIAEEEWQLSRYDKDLATIRALYYQNLIEMFQTRYQEKSLLASFLKGIPYDIEKLYYLYSKEWATQCQVSKYALKTAELQVRIQTYLVDLVKNLHNPDFEVATYYELATREKDLGIARADLIAKKRLDDVCSKELPTLEEIKKLAEGGAAAMHG